MPALLMIISMCAWLLGIVCAIFILIGAFKDAIWKGIVGLLCGLYLLYYALAEFDHEKKWLIVAGWLLGFGVAGTLQYTAAASMATSGLTP